MDSVSSRVLDILSYHDPQLVSHFKSQYTGVDNVESITDFYCSVLSELPHPNVSIEIYWKDVLDCEFRWFRCFSEQVIPELKTHVSRLG